MYQLNPPGGLVLHKHGRAGLREKIDAFHSDPHMSFAGFLHTLSIEELGVVLQVMEKLLANNLGNPGLGVKVEFGRRPLTRSRSPNAKRSKRKHASAR